MADALVLPLRLAPDDELIRAISRRFYPVIPEHYGGTPYHYGMAQYQYGVAPHPCWMTQYRCRVVPYPYWMTPYRCGVTQYPCPYFTPSSSTSKISVALGGMTPPAPRAP